MKNFKLVSATLIVALFALAAWTEPTQPVVKKEITQEVSCLDVTTEELTCEAPLVLATLPPCFTQAHLDQFLSCYGACMPSDCADRWDLNESGCVDVADLLMVLARMCP